MSDNADPADFRPTANWDALRLRAMLLRELRQYFDERGFLEVETPILSADTVIDRHLDPFYADCPHPKPLSTGEGPNSRRMWLQTSPEFAMKRLLAAGATAIYQTAHVFRLDESGPCTIPSSHWSSGIGWAMTCSRACN